MLALTSTSLDPPGFYTWSCTGCAAAGRCRRRARWMCWHDEDEWCSPLGVASPAASDDGIGGAVGRRVALCGTVARTRGVLELHAPCGDDPHDEVPPEDRDHLSRSAAVRA